MHMRNRFSGFAACVGVVVALGAPVLAHKPITSKYTYNSDVYPIFKARCGQCHVAGGPAPMSLLNYKDAIPWAESIREELVAEKMPPSFVDPFGPPVKGAGHLISPKELDTIITWATGGTPEGDVGKRPGSVAASHGWPMGPPDAIIAMPADHIVPETVQEETAEIALDTGFTEARTVKAADLLPGDAAIVRDATIAVENGPVLSAWVPGEPAAMPPDGAGFVVPAGARLRLRIHYKKGWQDERTAKKDRSRVGLYFAANAGVRAIESLALNDRTRGSVSVVAVRPRLDRPYASLDVDAVLSDGSKVPLLRLSHPRPEWPRRYWLEKPIELPAGAMIQVATTPLPADPDEPVKAPVGALEAAVEFVATH